MKNLRRKLIALDITAAVSLILVMLYILILSVKLFIPSTISPPTEGSPAEVTILFFGTTFALAIVAILFAMIAFFGIIVGGYGLLASLCCIRKIGPEGVLLRKKSYLGLQISSAIVQALAAITIFLFTSTLPPQVLPAPLLCAACLVFLIAGLILKSKFLRVPAPAETEPLS